MQITYNLLNLPQVISRGNVAQARYIYTADSIKCETAGNADGGYAYLGSLIFIKNAAGYAFESAQFGGGRIIHTTGTIAPAYYTTDHLGSVRMITDANGTIQEQNDYYPFGGRHTSGNTYAALPGNNFKFNGKEEQTTGATGYLDYGARMYDNVTGRWGTPDPLAEKYYSLTPYDFCGSNPVSRIDPNGMNWYQNSRGNTMWRNSASDSFVDENRAVWTNIGETYTHHRSDGSSVFFYQKTNQDGDMTLASHTFSPNETAAFGLFHSNEAREAAMQDHVNPTWGSFLSMVAKEMKAQWTDPYLLTVGMTMGLAGKTNLNFRPDIILSGGRSGQLVKNLTGPANSIIKGNGGRIFIKNDLGQVVWDITSNRAKPVIPGKGFGEKITPTRQQLKQLHQILNKEYE